MFILLYQSIAFPQSSPAPVNLGTAEEFVLLAKSGITSTGTTQITGDVGVSPAAASYITGFGLIMHSSNTYSTSSLVTGKVYAADYADPTPRKLTTAIGDMQTAYTNAAGRTLPDYTELYTGNITGKTLTHGLYKWSTGVLVNSGGVTISGTANDVWIFQIAQNLVLTSGAIVTLSGGAKASNIFWQVAGQITIGTTVAMKGILLSKTQIVMNTGATLNGRALAQTAITMDANSVIQTASVNQSYVINATALLQGFWNGTTTVRDTVTVELHGSTPPYLIVATARALSSNLGALTFNLSGVINEINYYLILKHRNSIETWSANPVSFSANALGYNFTTAASKAYGNNLVLKTGKYCIYSGDPNQDGFVDFSDLTRIDNDAYYFAGGYLVTDLNGDQFVDFSDLTLCDNNAYNYVGVSSPVQVK